MSDATNTPCDPALLAQIAAALANNPARVQKIAHRGRDLWLKRPETLTLLRRLQKGDPNRAFEAERQALHLLTARGAPVPAILAEGPDFIALCDSGTPLSYILTTRSLPAPDRLAIFAAAGRALADLHRKGLSHGRPSLKDICWDGARISFLDFERYAESRNTPKGHAMDVVMFVFNGMSRGGGPTPEMQAAIDSYRTADPGGIWERAQHWCARRWWIDWLTKPVQRRKVGKAKEFKAIPDTLKAFTAG